MGKFSLLEKISVGASGVASFVLTREPITEWYTNFAIMHYEINDCLDAILVGAHVGTAGILAATAIGVGTAYAAKKSIDYFHNNRHTENLSKSFGFYI